LGRRGKKRKRGRGRKIPRKAWPSHFFIFGNLSRKKKRGKKERKRDTGTNDPNGLWGVTAVHRRGEG